MPEEGIGFFPKSEILTYEEMIHLVRLCVWSGIRKVRLTGDKLDKKVYYRHSGFPGGIKGITAREMLEKKPEQVIKNAVKGMLPKNRLGVRMIGKLKIYAGPDHPHEAQKPEKVEL